VLIVLRDLTRAAYPLQRNSRKLQSHWASLLQTDPAPLHACICCAASNQALMSGDLPLVDPTKRWSSPLVFDSFLHRGETIKLVNRGLSDPAKASSDALIAAVSILITIEVRTGDLENTLPGFYFPYSTIASVNVDHSCPRWRSSSPFACVPSMCTGHVPRLSSSSLLFMLRASPMALASISIADMNSMPADRFWEPRGPEDPSGGAPADGRPQRELCGCRSGRPLSDLMVRIIRIAPGVRC